MNDILNFQQEYAWYKEVVEWVRSPEGQSSLAEAIRQTRAESLAILAMSHVERDLLTIPYTPSRGAFL